MDNFNLKKYLAEGKLIKELEAIDAASSDLKEFIQAVEKASNSEEIFEKFENWVDSFMPGAIKEDLKKYLAKGTLLNENAPGYDTRKFGEALPTLESVKAAHEAKEDDKEEIKEERFDGEREMMMHIKQYRDGMIDGDDLVQAFEEIINGSVTPPGYNTRYGR